MSNSELERLLDDELDFERVDAALKQPSPSPRKKGLDASKYKPGKVAPCDFVMPDGKPCGAGTFKAVIGENRCGDHTDSALYIAAEAEKEKLKDDLGLIFKTPAVPRTKPRPYVMGPLQGEIDGWFPLGEVSLVGAPSGASKTTFLYQMLLAQKEGEMFLGHTTFRRKFAVAAVDRGEAAHETTMQRMGLPLKAIPFGRMKLAWDIGAVQQIIRWLEKLQSQGAMPEVIVVEGVDMLVSEVGEIKCITEFMVALDRVAKHFNIAVIGTLGSPKLKIKQGYSAKRDNLLGSQAWARLSETVVVLQFPEGDDIKGLRLLFALLRNAPAEKFTLGFKDGKLAEVADVDLEVSAAVGEIVWFEGQADWWTVLDMARAFQIGELTAWRHIQDAVAKGIVRKKPGPKSGRGGAAMYQWDDSPSNPVLAARAKQFSSMSEKTMPDGEL